MASDNPAVNFVEYMKGVGDSAVNIAEESAYGVYDFGQVAIGGAKIAAKEGLSAIGANEAAAKIMVEDIEPLSALGKAAAQGGYEGLGDAVKSMPGNMAHAVADAVQKGDMRALGGSVTDAVLMAEGARVGVVGAAKSAGKAAAALKPAVNATAEAAKEAVGKAKAALGKSKTSGNPEIANKATAACEKKNDIAARGKHSQKDANIPRNFEPIYEKAPAAKKEIDSMADEIAEKFNGKVAKAPLKSRERAIEKIMNDYDGDATRIKDLARNTIIVSPDKMDVVVNELVNRGANVKVINGETDPLGYSGVNSTIKTQAGIVGEVQVNTPAMIYAKESETMARALLGDEIYNSVATKTGIAGGQGHKFYEQWRTLADGDPMRPIIESQSKAYYESIRNLTNGN
ncbi:hypothetical protein [Methylobacter marinus]|uniref:hypothetical protein n=1 Tax=Methylobacter marinus TaxID=34058 RepID=UPI00036F22EE|nr:hypothetical protein [Methylobacter marinus]